MEFEQIEMDVTADDYEALKSFCRIYHIPENDGLSAGLNILYTFFCVFVM